ncbi:hypothetical protein K505DRAFT_325310 [Melanomma pulvis-pyrius CBS 109.77]|uniref:Uncharacterized protein n=1 Tax=Melanomma pulvis-pyrius CBS 109.77 TaxID=1314802 RepID=A0A6A6XB78_9PLEO|nr:hypothetical protein K505DRAFT_325310 [Melanomma pulvis-pyrius CBS 109.77]
MDYLIHYAFEKPSATSSTSTASTLNTFPPHRISPISKAMSLLDEYGASARGPNPHERNKSSNVHDPRTRIPTKPTIPITTPNLSLTSHIPAPAPLSPSIHSRSPSIHPNAPTRASHPRNLNSTRSESSGRSASQSPRLGGATAACFWEGVRGEVGG